MIVAENDRVMNTAIRMRSSYDARSLELLSKVLTKNYKGRAINSMLAVDIISDIHR